MNLKCLSLLIFSFFISVKSFSAACCGGGFSMPSLIAGDERAQVSGMLMSNEVVVDNVDSTGVWRKAEAHQQVKTFRLDMAGVLMDPWFDDRWQAGLSLPIMQRTLVDRSYSGLGDVSLSLGYEYLPDWDYNLYRPKGMAFFQLILPTGKSKFDSEVGGLDSRGNDLWSVGVGTLLSKIIKKWDFFTSIDIHKSFSKKIDNSNLHAEIRPGFGGSYALGMGYNLKDYRLGTAVSWVYEDPIDLFHEGGTLSRGYVERYATASFNLTYMANLLWSASLVYNDQTLFGSPENTSLSKGITIQLIRKWSR